MHGSNGVDMVRHEYEQSVNENGGGVRQEPKPSMVALDARYMMEWNIWMHRENKKESKPTKPSEPG